MIWLYTACLVYVALTAFTYAILSAGSDADDRTGHD